LSGRGVQLREEAEQEMSEGKKVDKEKRKGYYL
jgi:hypothetical protein